MKNSNELFIQDYGTETERIVRFIRGFIVGCPRKKAILGLSGGIDSAVNTSLCCRVLGPKNVHVVLMPAPNSSRSSMDDALDQANALQIPSENIHIKPIDKALLSFGYNPDSLQNANLGIGNTAARLRMTTLFKIADEVGAVVCGTENRTEHLFGYFTIGGDEISHFEPTRHLYKTEIRGLAEHLGDVIPEIRNKKPSAELFEGQTDESEFGFSYNDADIVLVCLGQGDILKALRFGVKQEVMTKVLRRKNFSEFKRERPFFLERE